MNMDNDKYIEGGAFQIARKIFESDLWLNKPASWKVIWIYILGNVNHAKTDKFERGEGFFNLSRELKNIGNDITPDMVKKLSAYARANGMISTRRSTRGMIIKVINYDRYQALGNYIKTSISTSQSTSKAQEKHERSTPIDKNDNNENNDNKSITLQEIFNHWNSLPLYSKDCKNITARSRLLVNCRAITPDIETVFKKLKGYSKEDFELSIKNYCLDIINRDPTQDFSKHRFSFYEFFKQSNGFIKFLNK